MTWNGGRSMADLRMRASLYLGRTITSDDIAEETLHEVMDRAEADRAALEEKT